MIIPDLDDLVLESDEESGIQELGRRFLARGPWTTVAFLVKTRTNPDGDWEGPALWLHRYQKVAQGWKLVSRFRTTEAAQLETLAQALEEWKGYFSTGK
jgi:lipopolysaccharide biosynthesis protein